jgi:hypothetical protein
MMMMMNFAMISLKFFCCVVQTKIVQKSTKQGFSDFIMGKGMKDGVVGLGKFINSLCFFDDSNPYHFYP